MDLIFLIYFLIIIIATYEDIKKREVYDFINFLLVVLILNYSLVTFILYKDYKILFTLIYCVIGFLIGYLLFLSGSWGFGDTKYLISLGGLSYLYNGYLVKLLSYYFRNEFLIHLIIFFIYLFLSFICSGIVSVFIIFYGFVKNFKKLEFSNYDIVLYFFLVIFDIVILIFLNLFPRKMYILFFMLSFFILLFNITKKIEKFLFISKKPIPKIVPGDWIIEDVKVDNRIIFKKERFRLGIEEKDLNKLNDLYKKNKLKEVLVKDGVPFFVGFLIAYPLVFFDLIRFFI